MKNAIVLTDEMIDAAYNRPDKTPDPAKRLMRDAVERILRAGGYEVVDAPTHESTAVHISDEYDNWRWKMERVSGLFGTSVFARHNVQYRKRKDASNPACVMIAGIKSERNYELLLEWARNYFPSSSVGNGRSNMPADGLESADRSWWVRLDAKELENRMLPFPLVMDRVDAIDPYVVQQADADVADGEDEVTPEQRMLQLLIAHSPIPAAQWNWPVKFSIESVLPHVGPRRIRFVCEDEGNNYALYHAVADIIGVGPAHASLAEKAEGFIVTSTENKLVTGTLLAALPVECRPRDGETKEFVFNDRKGTK